MKRIMRPPQRSNRDTHRDSTSRNRGTSRRVRETEKRIVHSVLRVRMPAEVALGAEGRRFESCLPDHFGRAPVTRRERRGPLRSGVRWLVGRCGHRMTSNPTTTCSSAFSEFESTTVHEGPRTRSTLDRAAAGERQAQVQSSSNTRNSASHDASRHSSLKPQPASAMHVTSASKAAARSPSRTDSPHARAQASSSPQP